MQKKWGLRDVQEPLSSLSQSYTEAFRQVNQLTAQHAVHAIPTQILQLAQDLFEQLRQSTCQQVLLHGDLHHDNILLDQQRGWLAIDPKGMVGDPACQAARLLRNPLPALLQQNNPAAVTKTRVDILAARLQQEPQRVLQWAFTE